MSTLYIIRKTVVPALLIAVLGLSGCLRDSTDEIPVPPETKGVKMNISVPGMQDATRAFSDSAVSELDIVVFNASGIFVEHVPATVIATGLSGGSVTQVYAPITTGTGYTVAVVANFRSTIEATALTGMSKAAFRNLQVKQKADNNFNNILWNWNKAQPELLPMYGEVVMASASIPAGEALNVKLTRVHARIDFHMEDAVSDIKDIWFRWFQISGSLAFNGSFQNPGVSSRDIVLYPRLPGASFRSAEGFYVFEEPAQVNDPGSFGFVIVRAKYAGVYYYYRIDFISDGSFPGYAKGEFIPVQRNYRYDVVINEVLGPGYDDFGTASSSKSEVNNLRYTILTENEEAGHIVYDGNYYLSVEKTEFEVPKSGVSDPDFLELFVRTNYDSPSHLTDAWKVTKFDAGITPVGVPTTESMTFFMGPAYTTGKIRFRVDPNPGNGDRVLTFTIGAGKLSQVITIKQSGTAVDASIIIEQLPGTFTYYSWNGVLLEDYKSQLMLDWIALGNKITVETIADIAPVTDPKTEYKPFAFSTAAGFDDLTGTRTYTGSKKLFTIAPVPAGYEQDWAPYRSTIRITAKGDNGTVTRDIPVRHKNIFAALSVPDYAYVASNKLEQSIRIAANTTYTLTKLSDLQNDVTGFTTRTISNTNQYNNPFNYSTGGGVGAPISFYNKSVRDLGAGINIVVKLSTSLYSGYGGTKEFNFNMPVIPVGERANSYIVKPGDWAPAIPLSQANVAMGDGWIDVSAGVSATKWIIAEIEWSDSPGVVEVPFDGSIRYCPKDYPGTPEVYLVVKGVKEGNAVVSVSQWNGTSYDKKWSWHIWVTADKAVIENGIGPSHIWMDRNMGALTANPYVGGTGAYDEDLFLKSRGLFYSWGRKEPFPTSNEYYTYNNGTVVLPAKTFNAANNTLSVSPTLTNLIQNPIQFDNSGNSSWRGVSGGATSWHNSSRPTGKSAFDPCPPGWKVPTKSNLTGGVYWGGSPPSGNMYSSNIGWIPLGGYRKGFTATEDMYTKASFWFSTNDTPAGNGCSYSLNASSSQQVAGDSPMNYMMNVRCITEYPPQ